MNIDELLKKEAFLSSSNLLRVVVSKKLENIKSITFIQLSNKPFGIFVNAQYEKTFAKLVTSVQ